MLSKIFKNCKNYTLDEDWKRIFEDCSMEKYPYGMSIDDKYVTILKKKKENFIVEIPFDDYHSEEDTGIMFVFFMEIFRNELNLCSKSEQSQIWKDIQSSNSIIEDPSSLMKNKNFKNAMFNDYILRKSNGKWSDFNIKYILSMLNYYYNMKHITAKDIKFENYKIVSINKIILDENGNITFDPNS